MRQTIGIILVLGIVLGNALTGCAPAQDKNAEKAEQTDAEEMFLPPEDLIITNVRETDLSLAFELEDVQTMKNNDDLYGEWELSGPVFQVFDGAVQAGERFTCYQIFEKGITAPKPGTRFIGSFKKTAEGKYGVPDNGYLFPYHPDLLLMFEKAAKQKATP